MTRSEFPDGMEIRAPEWDDLEQVNTLIRACEAYEHGEAESEVDDLRGAWERQRFDLSRDASLAVSPEGNIAGYVAVWEREPAVRFVADGHVHPDWRGRGIGARLVRLAEGRVQQRLRETHSAKAVVQHTVSHGSEESRRLLESEGYSPVAYFWQMVKQMKSHPAEPRTPEGITIRTFERGRDEREVYELVQAAFSDNADPSPLPFHEWSGIMLGRESFDPSLYFLALAGDELAGVALCPRYETSGWVRQLAVRRDWRRRGVGRALMERVYAEFFRRGQRKVGLVVDSYNRTGAKQFYESLGMRVERQYDRYEKALVSSS